MNKSQGLDVSIVLACYNAAAFLNESVRQIEDTLDASIYRYEIIFVDDHSQDDTKSVIRDLINKKNHYKLIRHETNEGRGNTLRDGFHEAEGPIICVIDLDLNNPARYITPLLTEINRGDWDICTAQRIYKQNLGLYFLTRKMCS